jgi:hypothetical protein
MCALIDDYVLLNLFYQINVFSKQKVKMKNMFYKNIFSDCSISQHFSKRLQNFFSSISNGVLQLNKCFENEIFGNGVD